jgi:fructose-specific phosphotransferase system IIC component
MPDMSAPVIEKLYTLEEVFILIKGIKSQLNLKPYFYEKSAKAGTSGAIFGGFLAYLLVLNTVPLFGIDLGIPLNEYSDVLVYSVFAFGIAVLVTCLYLCCALSSALYFLPTLRNGGIKPEEYKDIVFKSLYPSRWQKK